MIKNGKGTILFTGATASLRGSAKFGGFAASKFALRALAQSMARELGPQGIHVAHIIIDGAINTPRQVQSKILSFLEKGKLLFIDLDEPDRDIESFLNSDAVRIILHLLVLVNDKCNFL
jgi:short-subunit dehydrogenase